MSVICYYISSVEVRGVKGIDFSSYLYRRYVIANDGHLKNIAEEEKSIPLTPLTSTEDI
jgi:hypothetical protein